MSKQRKNQQQSQREIVAQAQREEMDRLLRDSLKLKGLLETRAGKLLKKGKRFIVVAVDEPYFPEVYRMIRAEETRRQNWSEADEMGFWDAMQEWAGK